MNPCLIRAKAIISDTPLSKACFFLPGINCILPSFLVGYFTQEATLKCEFALLVFKRNSLRHFIFMFNIELQVSLSSNQWSYWTKSTMMGAVQ